jgi:glycogen debranching enzyme
MDTDLFNKAWRILEDAVVAYDGKPVGTVAARDPAVSALNYDQVFTRDFAVSAIAFLLNGKTDVVKNFLSIAVDLQSREKQLDCFRAGEGLMPASFKVDTDATGKERLTPDFGEKAIARVAPVDSGFWWLYILRVYVNVTGDRELSRRPEFQRAIRLILELALTNRFDMFPTLFVPDGSFMIDRRMGVYGYPLDIQSLFYMALRAARELLAEDDGENEVYAEAVRERLGHLTYHIRNNYWLDFRQLSAMYRYEVEGYGADTVNRFNIYPDSIPDWLFEWLPTDAGYFAGNLGPGRMDFRFFTAGNLMAVISSLADSEKADAVMNLFKTRWAELIGHMPLKVCYPAITGTHWEAVTGCDLKNIPWSYHNGGAWPFLLWLLAAAGVKTGRAEDCRRALEIAENRLEADEWGEYYDGRTSRLVGREARRYQTWTCAGYVAAFSILQSPEKLSPLLFETDSDVIGCAIRVGNQY